MSGDFSEVTVIVMIACAAVVAITMHEAAHGLAAWRLGDPTPHEYGRVSINPFRHLDLVGTIIIPAVILALPTPNRFMFGWAKPVPIDPMKMNNPRRDMFIVAAVGPLANLIVALFFAILQAVIGLVGWENGLLGGLFSALIFVNVLIALFNLIPLPPLDGGQVVIHLLPEGAAWRYKRLEPFGFAIILFVFFLLPLVSRWLGSEIDPFDAIVRPLVEAVVTGMESLTGATVIRLW